MASTGARASRYSAATAAPCCRPWRPNASGPASRHPRTGSSARTWPRTTPTSRWRSGRSPRRTRTSRCSSACSAGSVGCSPRTARSGSTWVPATRASPRAGPSSGARSAAVRARSSPTAGRGLGRRAASQPRSPASRAAVLGCQTASRTRTSSRSRGDADAVRQAHQSRPQRRPNGHKPLKRPGQPENTWRGTARDEPLHDGHPLGRNLRSVWDDGPR